MYGDTRVIRRLAHDLREQADRIRHTAGTLVGRADATAWTGLAADAMRARCRSRAGELCRTAALHDDAADALLRHAAEVDRLKELIAAIERKVRDLVGAAKDRLAQLGDAVLDGIRHLSRDPLDSLLAGFTAPPPGSRAWLDVDLPGVHP